MSLRHDHVISWLILKASSVAASRIFFGSKREQLFCLKFNEDFPIFLKINDISCLSFNIVSSIMTKTIFYISQNTAVTTSSGPGKFFS